MFVAHGTRNRIKYYPAARTVSKSVQPVVHGEALLAINTERWDKTPYMMKYSRPIV